MLTDTQRRIRRQGIGASDIPVIMGLSKYKTVGDLYADKVDGETSPDSEAALWGHLHETTIAKWVAGVAGAKVRRCRRLRHPVYRWAACTPDRLIEGWGYLEIKTRGDDHGWGPTDTTIVPADVRAQVQWSMWVAQVDHWYVGALIRGNDFRLYHLKADPGVQGIQYLAARAFWDQVLRREPPPEYQLRQWEQAPGDEILDSEDPSWPALLSQLQSATEAEQSAKAARQSVETALKLAIGPHKGYHGSWGAAYWQLTKGRPRTDWKAAVLAGHGGDLNEVVRQFTVVGDPYRRLIVQGETP